MKLSRRQVARKAVALPILKFEDQQLTSFGGLVVFQELFSSLRLREQLRVCFKGVKRSGAYGLATVVLQLVVHFLLGYRMLRDSQYYRDDPMVKRLLGLKRLPDVSTVSRMLAGASTAAVENLRELLQRWVLDRVAVLGLARITLDIDGSVQSTGRFAEGTAVGYNKKKRGQRSYWPLFCTIAQLGQVFDVLHRPGNVHDSHGAKDFILACVRKIRQRCPWAVIEVRMDGAFFDEKIIEALAAEGVEFTVSVPFRRLAELKQMVEERRSWRRCGRGVAYFEKRWKPQRWSRRFRFVFVRTRVKIRQKGPVQLDLFVPYEDGYEFKVIVTNKRTSARHLLAFHNGRGSQEAIFADLKNDAGMNYVPTRTLIGNQLYLLAGLLAHNLVRELQMRSHSAARNTTYKRSPLWSFESVSTLCRTVVQRAGRLTRPGGRLTLTMNANPAVKTKLLYYLEALKQAA